MWGSLLLAIFLCGFSYGSADIDWMSKGQDELSKILSRKQNKNVAKNVILFIGDGMGASTVTGARTYSRQKKNMEEEEVLSFEKFPHVSLSKVYNTDQLVPDSGGTATAMVCGVKTRFGVLGVNKNVPYRDCSQVDGNEVSSILVWAQAEGKSTGIVTTTSVTHATPAASYAHTADRNIESDADVFSQVTGQCEDIASQLINRNSDINVILGGGRVHFLPKTTPDPEYGTGPNATYGRRLDGRNLIQEWQDDKAGKGVSHSYVWNQADFNQVNPEESDYLLGLFEPKHMQYEGYRKEKDLAGEPSVADMVEKAIKILSKNENGFFLLVEGGRIDHAHHELFGKLAFEDTLALAEAVKEAVTLTNQEDSLIVVTADHSHTLTIGGYPSRDNDIFGLVDNHELIEDPTAYLTLSYANGPNSGYTDYSGIEVDFQDLTFQQPTLVPLPLETHSGEDVAIYASGPMAHLFSGVLEQNYIAHAMAYAACVGPNQQHCDKKPDKPCNPQENSGFALQNGGFWLACLTLISTLTAKLMSI